jgi:hypothetical protein
MAFRALHTDSSIIGLSIHCIVKFNPSQQANSSASIGILANVSYIHNSSLDSAPVSISRAPHKNRPLFSLLRAQPIKFRAPNYLSTLGDLPKPRLVFFYWLVGLACQWKKMLQRVGSLHRISLTPHAHHAVELNRRHANSRPPLASPRLTKVEAAYLLPPPPRIWQRLARTRTGGGGGSRPPADCLHLPASSNTKRRRGGHLGDRCILASI